MVENPPQKTWPYLLGGLAIGAAFGLLWAPKPGVETRRDLRDWLRQGRERGRGVIARFRQLKAKRAQLVAAVKAGREVFQSNNHRRHTVHA